jgi:hypothetical protein
MNRRNTWFVLGVIALLALALRIAFLVDSVRHVPASSDEALSVLQSHQILQGDFPLLVMANPYQFPIESYLFAPFAGVLPVSALGVRLIPFLLSLAAQAGFLFLLFRTAAPRAFWPGLLLMAFPSAYLMLLFSAYFIPQHSSFMLLSVLTMVAGLFARDQPRHALLWSGLAGFLGGLTVSNHLLGLPVLSMVAIFVCAGSDWKNARRLSPPFLLGLVVGLAPYLLARWLCPGSYQDVTHVLPWSQTLARLWSPAFTRTLPAAFGVNPCLFPDGEHALKLVPRAEYAFSFLWLAVVVKVSYSRVRRFIGRTIEYRWPVLEANDVFVGIAWVGLLLFVLNTRSSSHSFRYLLPVVWVFPFLWNDVYAGCSSLWRRILGAVTVLLVILNIVTTLLLARQWGTPEFAAREANIFDLKPVQAFLRERNIDRCYASYWAAYRLTFEAGEQTLCSQPYNERFFNWPLPYKGIVDQATNVAYVLAPRLRFAPERFERDLAAMDVQYQVRKCGSFRVYTDFRCEAVLHEEPVPSRSLVAIASHSPAQARNLVDGRPMSGWTSGEPQVADMWVELKVSAPESLRRISLFYNGHPHQRPRALTVQVRTAQGWEDVAGEVVSMLDRFQFTNGHPVYGDQVQTLRFEPRLADAVRIRISNPEPHHDWALGEVVLYRSAPPKTQLGR